MLVHPSFEKAYKKSDETDPYYLNKYTYLKHHGFFAEPKIADFATLEESVIKNNIVNVRQIVFETTESCNLNCTYCGLGEIYDIYDERSEKKINEANAITFLKFVFKQKPRNKNSKLFISFYGGEPLLNFNFIKNIVELANQLNTEKGFELVFSMTTNATLIHKYIDFLAEYKFQLLISIDGNKRNHSYRVYHNNKNSFDKIIENIDIIQKNYSEYFITHINFNAVLHNRNSVKEIYEFIYKRYNKIPRISELNSRHIRPDKKESFAKIFQSKRESETEFHKKNSFLSSITHEHLLLYRELIDFLKYLSINYYISNVNALFYNTEKYFPTSTCTPFSKKIFFTSRNKLLPCERVNYKYPLGEVNENIEIDISAITSQFNFYYEYLRKFCQSCYAYKFCGTCLLQFENLEKINSEEFFCDRYQDQNGFKHKLHKLISFLEKYPDDFSNILENVIIE